jgi:UrcA family protein
LACLTLAPAAHAETTVPLDRADLADRGTVEAFYDKLERAARRECRKASRDLSALSPSVRRSAIDQCAADTLDALVRQVDAPELTAWHTRDARPSTLAARR